MIPQHFFTTASEVRNFLASSSVDTFGMQLVPLLRVRVDEQMMLLLKPSTAGYTGYNIENVRAVFPRTVLGDEEFLARAATCTTLASTKDWELQLTTASGCSMQDLRDDLLRNFGWQSFPERVVLTPFPAPAVAWYVGNDEGRSRPVLFTVVYLRLELATEDYSFFSYTDTEYVPEELCLPGVGLHPRYAIHPVVPLFYHAFGSPTGGRAMADCIPVVEWRPAREHHAASPAFTFVADFSANYVGDLTRATVPKAFFPPNPGSRNERFLRELQAALATASRPRDVTAVFRAHVTRHLVLGLSRTGCYFRSLGDGKFCGMVELPGDSTAPALAALYALLDFVRFFKRVRILADYRPVPVLPRPYEDHDLWFNLRHDNFPFDVFGDWQRLEALLADVLIPLEDRGLPLGWQRQALVISDSLCAVLPPQRLLCETQDDVAVNEALAGGHAVPASRDDSLVAMVPRVQRQGALGTEAAAGGTGTGEPGTHSLFIWRIA